MFRGCEDPRNETKQQKECGQIGKQMAVADGPRERNTAQKTLTRVKKKKNQLTITGCLWNEAIYGQKRTQQKMVN